MKEEEIKYLAGLLDADGSMTIQACKSASTGKYYVQLRLSIFAKSSIDKHGYLKSLADRFGVLSEINEGCAWTVGKRSDLNKLIPRLTKHMIVKAKHWDTLFRRYSELAGIDITEEEALNLRGFSDESRKNTGPLKPKNFPSKAWIAGFFDGDGCYLMRKSNKNNHIQMSIDVACDCGDRIGIDLLQKTLGGYIHQMSNSTNLRWKRNLGVRDRAFAITLLRNCHRHSRLKKWKIEQMLAFHNTNRND